MTSLSEEQKIIDDLEEGLASAILDHDQLDSDAVSYLSETKLQKLLYLAINKFDLPVTYSWYLAGAHIAEADVGVRHVDKNLNQISSNIGPKNQLLRDSRPEQKTRSKSGKDISEYEEFFAQILDDIWFKQRHDFLEEFYTEYAPEKYQNLYLRSLELRRLFAELKENYQEDSTKQLSLKNYSGGVQESNFYSDFEDVCRDLEFEIGTDKSISMTADAFSNFVDILLDVIFEIQQSDNQDNSIKRKQLVERANDFFFYNAWRRPCLYISKETATGPNAYKLVSNREQQIKVAETVYNEELAEFKKRCSELGASIGDK